MKIEELLRVTKPLVSIDRTHHDFGHIHEMDDIVQTYFVITNIGEEVLNLGTVSMSCGCTSAELEDHALEPGDSTRLWVYFNPKIHTDTMGGPIRSAVYLSSNDLLCPEIQVTLAMKIEENEE